MSKQEATSRQTGMLSLGVLILIVALSLLALSAGLIVRIEGALAIIIAFYGIWIMVLASMRASKPERYERGPFSILAWGLILIAVGCAWYMSILGLPITSALAIVLLIIGLIAIAAALRGSRRKEGTA